MTKRTLTNLALSVVALAGSTMPALAVQLDSLKISVPFAFRVGSTTLPAGSYNFVRENEAGLLRISGTGGSIMLITRPGSLVPGNGESSLAFHKSGNVAVLEQLRLAGDAAEIVPSASGR
jgi:hypothetical protein